MVDEGRWLKRWSRAAPILVASDASRWRQTPPARRREPPKAWDPPRFSARLNGDAAALENGSQTVNPSLGQR